MAKDCPSNRGPYHGSHRGGSFCGQGSTRGHRGSAHVNLCSTMGTPQLQSKEMGVQCGDDDIQINLVTKLPPESFPFGEFPSVDTVATVTRSSATAEKQRVSCPHGGRVGLDRPAPSPSVRSGYTYAYG